MQKIHTHHIILWCLIIPKILSQITESQNQVDFLNQKVKLQPSPIIINGGSLPALHIFHQPLWLPTIVRNTIDDFAEISDLQKLSDQIDLQMQNPSLGKTIGNQQIDFQKNLDDQSGQYQYKGKLQVNKEKGVLFDARFLQQETDKQKKIENICHLQQLLAQTASQQNTTQLCTSFQGQLKIRDLNENKTLDYFTMLTNKRFTFYLNEEDKSSIQNSMEIHKFKMPIYQLDNLKRCFQIQTPNKYVNIIACAENQDKSAEWVEKIQQNIINCDQKT